MASVFCPPADSVLCSAHPLPQHYGFRMPAADSAERGALRSSVVGLGLQTQPYSFNPSLPEYII
ncbi:hypothetical protein FRX31_025680 [Thalictrum thalictroides]|uniref:Uncharacterized protein n=1 Tax=Thalictrum thalictroides TaxID=46969 RepID=A0A7J6VI04_THATH|nr:hypothetical protein FRX31_025680 [Thalictrum thalictroides]